MAVVAPINGVEGGKVGRWEGGTVGRWEGGTVGRWDGAMAAPAAKSRNRLGPTQAAAWPIASKSSSLSSMAAPSAFSVRCSTEDVPGIGSITGERLSSQASAI
jgi:hypothetical protein